MELIDVLATLIKPYSPISSTFNDKCSLIKLIPYLHAVLYPDIITDGWIYFFIIYYAFLNNSDAIITTEVVPSPTSSSCNYDNYTIIFADGCSTSIYLKIVAPSFVIVTSPISSTNILSRPNGPNDDFTMLASDYTAVIFAVLTSLPYVLNPSISNPDDICLLF